MIAPGRHLFDRLTTESDVRLIAVNEPESLYLDYKAFPNHTPLDKDKGFLKLLAKAVSGFANAEGGILVIGVDDKSKSLVPISDLQDFAAKANEQLSRIVSFAVEGVETRPIASNASPNDGFLVVFVPSSDLAPHRSQKDHRYYRRTGESFVPMEHYEVADLFGRRHQPVLRPTGLLSGRPRAGQEREARLLLGVRNAGRGLARFPMLRVLAVSPGFNVDSYGIDGNYNFGLPARPGGSYRSCFSGGAGDVIHSASEIDVLFIYRRYAGGVAPRPSGQVALSVDLELAAQDFPCSQFRVEVTDHQIHQALAGGQKIPVTAKN